MLDAPAGLPYSHESASRHHYGSSRRAFRPMAMTRLDHALFFFGGCLILGLAIVLGIIVSPFCWLLLLLILPYAGMYFSLLEKEQRMKAYSESIRSTRTLSTRNASSAEAAQGEGPHGDPPPLVVTKTTAATTGT